MDAIFTSDKLDKSDELVNAINKLTINDSGYELNKENVSDAQGNPTSRPDTVTHNKNGPDTVTYISNGILDQNLLNGWTIREVSVLTLPTNPTIRLTPQTLLTPAMKKKFADVSSGNTWNRKTLQRINRTGIG